MESAGLSGDDLEAVRQLEDRAQHAWPTEESRPLDGWILRRTRNAGSRRVNSTLANQWHGVVEIDSLIARVEQFYHAHNQKPRFQVTTVSRPQGLDSILADRGYEIEAPVLVQHAACSGAGNPSNTEATVTISDSVTDDWCSVMCSAMAADAKSNTDMDDRIHTIGRIKPARALVTASLEGRPVSIGLGVYDQGYCGVFAMQTLPDYRRSGLAGSVLGNLAEWTLRQGGHSLYLQVEENNDVARAFYDARGFITLYNYHYRTLWD